LCYRIAGGRLAAVPSIGPGIYVPLVTPFDRAGHVDWPSLERLAADALDAGAAGLVALGTTGEPATLSPRERDGVIACCAGVCADRGRPLIAGVGGNDTAAAATEVERRSAEVDAILSVVPYYTRPSEAGVVRHFELLAAASAVPLVPYNIPYRTGRRLGAEALLELAAEPTIAGVKQSPGTLDDDTLRLVHGAPSDFLVLAGDDSLLFSMLCLGAAGGITASAHLCTRLFVRIHALVADDRAAQARALARTVAPLVDLLFAEPNPAVLKGVLAAVGRIPTAELRLPMTAARRASVDAAVRALAVVENADR
jgi:4-hydroxy-tetrahydrodipicolinate synthase